MRRSKADAEQTRLKILDAAERLFCTRGIAQTTLEGIARDKGQLTPDLTPEEATISQMVLINGLIGEWLRSGKAFGLAATGAKLLPHFIAALRPPKAPAKS